MDRTAAILTIIGFLAVIIGLDMTNTGETHGRWVAIGGWLSAGAAMFLIAQGF